MMFDRYDKILVEDINSKGFLGVGQIVKFKPLDLAEFSPMFKKRQAAAAKKIKDDYKKSQLRKSLVPFLAKVGSMQKDGDLDLQDALIKMK